jgi:hypothetical protein
MNKICSDVCTTILVCSAYCLVKFIYGCNIHKQTDTQTDHEAGGQQVSNSLAAP